MTKIPDPNAPIASLQQMLNALQPDLPALEANGEFNEATLERVMLFQRENGLPVTGTVDVSTWEALTAAYTQSVQPTQTPQPVSLYSPIDGWHVSPGEFSPLLYPIQGMFSALSEKLGGLQAVPPSGWLDQETAANFRMIQNCGQCTVCGSLNRATWNILRRTYETFVIRAMELPADFFT